jgi:hypothetical protein
MLLKQGSEGSDVASHVKNLPALLLPSAINDKFQDFFGLLRRPVGRMRWPASPIISFLLVTVLTGAPCEAAGQQLTGVLIRQKVNTAYSHDLAGLTTQLKTSGDRTVAVKPGETLSQIISREYAVGRSNARRAYEMIEREIVDRNALSGPNNVTAYTPIRVPNALKKALEAPNPRNWLNQIPKVAIDSRLSAHPNMSLDQLVQEPAERPKVDSTDRAGAAEALRFTLLTKEEAERVLALDHSATVESTPMDITFAQASGGPTPDWLPDATKQFLRAKLAAQPKQRPVLIVLDDAWPDNATFIKSKDFFESAIAAVRKTDKLPDAPFSHALKSAQAIDWTVATPSKIHAAEIRDSLVPLEQLTPPDGRVDTIYLPLFARDNGAAEVLTKLIALNLVLESTHPPYYGDIPSATLNWAETVADRIIKSLAARNQGTSGAGADIEKTDVAVIQAAMNFCSYFSEVSGRPCFLSMSWTTPNQWYQPNVPAGFYGLFVAATGNEEPTTNIYSLKRQFAARSMSPGDVLAVMNIDDQGNPTCHSSVFGTDLTGVFGVAYAGYLTPTDCGTSFAAPRVAWLLAAREATKDAPIDPSKWQKALELEILSRRASGSGYNQARFVPEEVFSR